MGLRYHVMIWVGLFATAILLLWIFRPILLPFVVGGTLAYLLNPVVNWLQKFGINRSWGAMIGLTCVIIALAAVLGAVVPLLVVQIGGLLSRLPGYVSDVQVLLRGWIPQLTEWLGPERTTQLQGTLTDMIGRGVEFVGLATTSLAQSGLSVLGTIAVLFITPVVAFYLLVDWEGMMKKADDLLPRPQQAEIRGVLRDIDSAMAGVIRGQGGVIVVLGIYYCTALTLTGLDYGLAIGLIGSLLSFIPYVGYLTSLVLALTIASVQFLPDQWILFAIVLVIYAVGQFLEANILYPKLVGQSININPVWLMFALFAFGLLFGFVGLLLAVPLAAITGVLTRYAITKYRQSSLYLGPAAKVAPSPTETTVPTAAKSPRKPRLTAEK